MAWVLRVAGGNSVRLVEFEAETVPFLFVCILCPLRLAFVFPVIPWYVLLKTFVDV